MNIAGLFRKCTDEVTPSQFAAHGRVEMAFDGDILLYEATGPFNRELFESLAQAQLDFLSSAAPRGPWASICLIRTSALTSPEGLARFEEAVLALNATPYVPVATAFVVPPQVEGGKIMLPLIAALYARAGRPFQGFETMAEARAWVKAYLAAPEGRLHTP